LTAISWGPSLKTPCQRGSADVGRPFHDNEAGALDKALRNDLGNDLAGVVTRLLPANRNRRRASACPQIRTMTGFALVF